MNNKRNILLVASWLPNRTDEYTGDFILRHTFAIEPFANLKVLYIGKDDQLKNKKIDVQRQQENGVDVIRIYYAEFHSFIQPINQIVSFVRYFEAFFRALKILKNENFKIELVHCNVLFKSGLIGWWLKSFQNIPYIITEHWSIFMPEDGFYEKQNFLFKFIAKKIANNANEILPVSNSLKKALINHGLQPKKYEVVPNVVDTSVYFYHTKMAASNFKFFHISSLLPSKNVEKLIRSFLEVKKKYSQVELHIIGGEPNELSLFEKYFHDSAIKFYGIIPYQKIPELLKEADCFVLFSQFETFSCVVSESLCMGIPCISSKIGGPVDLINSTNGCLVESENENQLAETMKWMIENQNFFDRRKIAEAASARYSYNAVGKQFAAIYEEIIENIK